jgi:hypothetical protein
MTTVIVPVNTFGAALSIPADGEGVSSASVALYVQEIANRLEFIRRRTLGAQDVSTAISLRLDASQAQLFNGTANYRLSAALGTAPTVDNLVVSATETFLVPFPYLVPGVVIRGFGGLYRGAGAHAALPAVMPKVELVSFTALPGGAATPTLTAVDSQSDTSGTTAALQLAHYVSKTVAPITVADPVMYMLRMTGESGANSLLGGQWSSFFLTISGN